MGAAESMRSTADISNKVDRQQGTARQPLGKREECNAVERLSRPSLLGNVTSRCRGAPGVCACEFENKGLLYQVQVEACLKTTNIRGTRCCSHIPIQDGEERRRFGTDVEANRLNTAGGSGVLFPRLRLR
jgi:hypothetical protein